MNDAVRSCTKKRTMENESSMPRTHSPGDDVFGLLAADLEVEVEYRLVVRTAAI